MVGYKEIGIDEAEDGDQGSGGAVDAVEGEKSASEGRKFSKKCFLSLLL